MSMKTNLSPTAPVRINRQLLERVTKLARDEHRSVPSQIEVMLQFWFRTYEIDKEKIGDDN